MVKFIIAFIFKPDFGTAIYSTFAVSFFIRVDFSFSQVDVQIFTKNEKVPKCSSFKTDSRVRKQLILKNKIIFCYLPDHFFNQVTCWLSPSESILLKCSQRNLFSRMWVWWSSSKSLRICQKLEDHGQLRELPQESTRIIAIKALNFVDDITISLWFANLKQFYLFFLLLFLDRMIILCSKNTLNSKRVHTLFTYEQLVTFYATKLFSAVSVYMFSLLNRRDFLWSESWRVYAFIHSN